MTDRPGRWWSAGRAAKGFVMSIEQFIDNEVKSNDVVLFMKGTPQFPQCGFSGQVVQILDHIGVPYKGHNVLENAEFARLGGLHRNTFLNSPRLLDESLRLKAMPRLRFAGQITGCEGYVESAAIGLMARRFAAAGARVSLVARSAEAIQRLAGELGGAAFPADLLDPASVDGLIGRIEAQAGPIDVLVNNAGLESTRWLVQEPTEVVRPSESEG